MRETGHARERNFRLILSVPLQPHVAKVQGELECGKLILMNNERVDFKINVSSKVI
jgi:hypothetical protein